jgi:thiamine biosynthesis lipoprotein
LFNPLVDLAALGYNQTWPNTTEPGEPNPVLAHQRLEMRGNEVRVPRGRALDLGGVAKGMAADWAISYLKEAGANVACANIGGDVCVLGERQVVVEDAKGAVWWSWNVSGGGVCTSSTKSRAWSGVHHIVNPQTGLSADAVFHTVSSHAGSAVAAEIANKAALVSGDLEHSHEPVFIVS